jgi:uncharacterized protein
MKVVIQIFKFSWDGRNTGKNKKHSFDDWECEEVFFDQKKVLLQDTIHSAKEERYILLGRTKRARLLYIVFTIRASKIRIISARDISKKEVHLYEKTT